MFYYFSYTNFSYIKARIHQAKREWNKSIECYKKVISASNGNTDYRIHYRLGFVLSKAKRWQEAVPHLQKSALAVPKNERFQIRLAMALENSSQNDKALDIYESIIKNNSSNADLCLKTGILLIGFSRAAAAENILKKGILLAPQRAIFHFELALALKKQGKWWQAIDALEKATSIDKSNADWFYQLGDAFEKMGRYEDSVVAFSNAVKLSGNNAEWFYRLGFMAEKSGLGKLSDNSYAKAIINDDKIKSSRFGIGVFHQARGYWAEAAQSYSIHAQKHPKDALLLYKLGMAYDRCYQWTDAANAYRSAIILNNKPPYWHYRLGFAYERMYSFDKAASAYANAVNLAKENMPEWIYRLGFSLYSAGKYEDAAQAWIKAIEVSLREINSYDDVGLYYHDLLSQVEKVYEEMPTDANAYFQLANTSLLNQYWDIAATLYKEAVIRCNQYEPEWYARLGYALYMNGDLLSACEAFMETQQYKRPYGIEPSNLEKNPSKKTSMIYVEYYETLPLRKNCIMYECYFGKSVNCNPFAMFEYIVNNLQDDFLHVWVVDPIEIFPEKYKKLKNLVLVKKDSDLYLRYLASAEYLINNCTFPVYFIRRPEQKYLNTWHGTPIKTLGKDLQHPGKIIEHRNAARNFLHATHIISPNSHTTSVLIERHDINGLYTGLIAESGYPRIDRLLNIDDRVKQDIKDNLGLDKNKPIILYAPTWRGTFSTVQVDADKLKHDLSVLADDSYSILFRGHHLQEKAIAAYNLPIQMVPASLDTYDLLSIVDILITDYSSIFFDFIPTRRPIIFYAYDKQEYIDERGGLYFDFNELPGVLCENIDSVKIAVHDSLILNPISNENYNAAILRFCQHEDGHSSQRAVDFFLKNDCKFCVELPSSPQQKILFFAGHFIPNGITASFLNLANEISKKYSISVVLQPESIQNHPDRTDKLSLLSKNIKLLGYVGGISETLEQVWINNRFKQRNGLLSVEMNQLRSQAFKREYKRLFGSATWDIGVNFEGYVPFWASFFSNVELPQKVIYLHNEMYEEMRVRFPYLRNVIGQYENYDRLISVSDSVNEANKNVLYEKFSIDIKKFAKVDNNIDGERIISMSNELCEQQIIEWVGDAKLIVNAARLSPEKDQEKLLNAFSRIREVNPNTKLLILGDGPLRVYLETLSKSLGIESHVKFMGLTSNPFPYMRLADVFVLSSNHEGQGLVLLEAMCLDVPVVSTDIPGPRSVITGNTGLLVENSIDGLVRGIESVLHGQVSLMKFDFYKYQSNAIEEFESHVIST